MIIPRRVLSRLIAGWHDSSADHYRNMADVLHDEGLDVWAAEAEAIADTQQALLLMYECMTDEQVSAASDEIIDRSEALRQAYWGDELAADDDDDDDGGGDC